MTYLQFIYLSVKGNFDADQLIQYTSRIDTDGQTEIGLLITILRLPESD